MTDDTPRRPGRPPKVHGDPEFPSAADAGVQVVGLPDDDMASMLGDDDAVETEPVALAATDAAGLEPAASAHGTAGIRAEDAGTDHVHAVELVSALSDPLADAPRDGRRIILTTTAGKEIEARWRYTRRYDPHRMRFVDIQFWEDPLRRAALPQEDYMGWRAY